MEAKAREKKEEVDGRLAEVQATLDEQKTAKDAKKKIAKKLNR